MKGEVCFKGMSWYPPLYTTNPDNTYSSLVLRRTLSVNNVVLGTGFSDNT